MKTTEVMKIQDFFVCTKHFKQKCWIRKKKNISELIAIKWNRSKSVHNGVVQLISASLVKGKDFN